MEDGAASGELHEVQRLACELSRLASDLSATVASAFTLDVRGKANALVDVERAGRALEAARLAVIRSLDGEDVTAAGSLTLATLLRDLLQTAPGRARADVAAARATDPDSRAGGRAGSTRGALAEMGAALAAGDVSRPHVDVAVRTLDKIPHRMRAAAAETVDAFFVDVSVRHPPRECEGMAAKILDRLDPTRTDRSFDPDAFARRQLDLVADSTGMLIVRGQLDPMTGAQLKAAIDHFAAPDPAQVDENGLVLGRDERTPGERRADGLGLVARLGLAGAGSRGGEPPRVVVHVTADQLAALGSGTNPSEQTAAGRGWCEQTGFITPDVLDRFGCSAVFERVLLAPNGAVLDLGRTTRLATAAQRRALAARDKGCVAPGCTRPASQCDAHHLTAWAAGGLTDVDGLVLLWGPHHNAVHAGALIITMIDGVPWVKSTNPYAVQGWRRNPCTTTPVPPGESANRSFSNSKLRSVRPAARPTACRQTDHQTDHRTNHRVHRLRRNRRVVRLVTAAAYGRSPSRSADVALMP